jgi:hypothetical protein
MERLINLFEFLPTLLTPFWKDCRIYMEAKPLGNQQENRFSLSGTCPHCNKPSVFLMVTNAHDEPAASQAGHGHAYWAVLQCQGCLRFILGAAFRIQTSIRYWAHFPLGKPNDEVAKEIPIHIGADLKEALRCRFIDAYNATVEMCRRAIQAACLDLNAPGDKQLVQQIDWLAAQGTITTPLKDMAHRIRLGGNLGAHPPEDPDDPDAIEIGPEYSDAVIEFTRDFFQHVYVMPERLKQYTFKKPVP